MTTLRAQFDGKALVPVDPVNLQAGHLYEVDVREPGSPAQSSSPQDLLRLLEALPKIPPEDIDQMEAEIKRGELPIRFEDPFGNGSEG
ncbi:MAG: hypothetical protein ABSD28_06310 [Tepidisphaeraceae bacterium]|jgi:hypothetical protein